MARNDTKLPIILGMNPPTKEVLIFKHKNWNGEERGYDVYISHANFTEGTVRGQEFSITDESVERKGLACVLHFTDADAMERFGQMLIDFASGKKGKV